MANTTYTPTAKGKKQISGGILYSTDSDGNLILSEQVWDEQKQRKVSDFGFLSSDGAFDVKEVTQELINADDSKYQQNDLGLWDVTRAEDSGLMRFKGGATLVNLLGRELNDKTATNYVDETVGNVYHLSWLIGDSWEGEVDENFPNTQDDYTNAYVYTLDGQQLRVYVQPDYSQMEVTVGDYILIFAAERWVENSFSYNGAYATVIYTGAGTEPLEYEWYLSDALVHQGDNMVCAKLAQAELKVWDDLRGEPYSISYLYANADYTKGQDWLSGASPRYSFNPNDDPNLYQEDEDENMPR